MHHSRPLYRKNYVILVALLILLVGGMLSLIASARLSAFHQYHLDTGHESAAGVEKQVSFYIAEKQRLVELFAEEQIDWLRALAETPFDDELHENLKELLSHHFPGHFAFSLADVSGVPIFENFDGEIGELCLSDIKEFSQTAYKHHPYIHPNEDRYHFDIMVHYGKDKKEGIFFVSFTADVLGNIINSIKDPNQEIMLILPGPKDLIEVVAEGARNTRIRDDYRLSVEERARILMRHGIKGTRWQVVDFHNTELHVGYRNKLIIESIGTFLVFLTIAALLVIRLRREEHQREMAEEQKQALMSVVSHEFRSPASVIKSALDLVKAGDAGEVSREVEKYIDMASSSTSRLLLLVNDFLDIQKLESGGLTFEKQETQLSSVVTDAVFRNKLYAEQFSAHFEFKNPLANDHVSCDANRIEQVLINFLSNAAKYGGENDTIMVTVARTGKRLRVSVSDHGPGIPEAFQSRVFEKFSMANIIRSEQQKAQKVKSSGLGLSIAKAIVEQHGGSIGFDTITDTQIETGTTFWFELPIL